jgi:CheY-like chemotaxis protein
MGLQGQLQEMPFVDILQLVAFSQKNGYLYIDGPFGLGSVVFRDGKVVCAYAWSTLDYVRRIAAGQYEEGQKDAVIQEVVETSLREMARLQDGNFHFQVAHKIAPELHGVDISTFLSSPGINAQGLLLELTRELDEDRRDTTAMLESGFQLETQAPVPAEAMPPAAEVHSSQVSGTTDPLPPGVLDEPGLDPTRTQVMAPIGSLDDPLSSPIRHEGCTVVVVDDEPVVAEVVGEELQANGYQVFTATTPLQGANLVKERVAEGEEVLVVSDLKMPTTTGKSFFGGFEVARRVRKLEKPVPVLLMVERLSDKARRRAIELGVRKVAFKPALSKLDSGQYKSDLRLFGHAILRELAELAAHQSPPESQAQGGSNGEPVDGNQILEFLASMTEQLIDPRRSVDISRMVLQAAERFFERGVLFLLKNERASGLSGFGLAKSERDNVALAQKLSIGIESTAPVQDVVARRKTRTLDAELALLEPGLFSHIGRGRAAEAALVPMLNNAEVLLILYGDNGLTGKPLTSLTALEVFMGQAGMALENVFLQGKLRSLDAKLSVGEVKE